MDILNETIGWVAGVLEGTELPDVEQDVKELRNLFPVEEIENAGMELIPEEVESKEKLVKKAKSYELKNAIDSFEVSQTTALEIEDTRFGVPSSKLLLHFLLRDEPEVTEVDFQKVKMPKDGIVLGVLVAEYKGELTQVVASKCGVSDLAVAKVSLAVQERIAAGSNSLETLDLSENDISDTGGYIGSLLEGNETLQQLVLFKNRLSYLCVSKIGESLKTNKTLVRLDLTDNKISFQGMAKLFKGISQSNTLQELFLGDNKLGRKGATIVGKLIEVNTSLIELQLQGNEIGDGKRRKGTDEEVEFDTDGVHALAAGLDANNTLKKLRLGNNEIGDAGMESIARVIATKTGENEGLDEIWLPSNLIGDHGLELLTKSLVVNRTIKTVNLADNHIDTGAVALAVMIAEDKDIEHLILSDNAIDDTGAEVFAKALIENQSLKIVELDGNEIGDEGATKLGRVKEDYTIKKLDLSRNPFSDKIVEEVFGDDKRILSKDRYTAQANLDDFGVRIAESEVETCFSKFLLFFSVAVIFSDFVLDTLVVIDFVEIATNTSDDPCNEIANGTINYYLYAAVGIMFLSLPTIYLVLFFTRPKGEDTVPKRIGFALLNLLQLRVLYEAIVSVMPETQKVADEEMGNENHHLKEERTTTQELGSVRLGESVLESGPQALLQIHVLIYSTLNGFLKCSPLLIIISITVSITVLGQTLSDLLEKQLVIRANGKEVGFQLFLRLIPFWVYHSTAFLFRAVTIGLFTTVLISYLAPVYLVITFALRVILWKAVESDRSFVFVFVVSFIDNSSWDKLNGARIGSVLSVVEGGLICGLLFLVPTLPEGNGVFNPSISTASFLEYQVPISIAMGVLFLIYAPLFCLFVSPIHDYGDLRKEQRIAQKVQQGDLSHYGSLMQLKSAASEREIGTSL